MQPSPTKITDYRFDLDRGDSDVREFPEDIDRKLIGFESIDELLSALHQQHPKQEKERLPERQTLEQPQKMFPTQKPTITIHYSRPHALLSPRTSPALMPLFRPAKSPEMRVRKVIEYEERMVRVPVEREIIEYGEIEELAEPSETRLQEKPPVSMPRVRLSETFFPKPNLSIANTQSPHPSAGNCPKKQDNIPRRFVTCEGYSF